MDLKQYGIASAELMDKITSENNVVSLSYLVDNYMKLVEKLINREVK